jgi:stearoyl-CoA desaturase (Delta-9 desaturase)
VTLFVTLWLATGLGITVGFHRYFSHQSFATSRPVALMLLIFGSMAARGPMFSWAAMHRRHHQTSDREGDLHSPNVDDGGIRGFLHAHLTWMVQHDYPNVTYYIPDLLMDKALARFNRRYYWWVTAGLFCPALVGGLFTFSIAGTVSGFLWGGLVRLFVVEHTMSAINSICHLIGGRPFFVKGDNSRNNFWLSLPSWGEAYHNNHHAFPNSAAFGLKWYELDPEFWFILALRSLGLAWDVRTPSPTKVVGRRGLADN